MTHAVVGAAIAQVLAPAGYRTSWSWIAAGCAVLPDADVIGFGFGVRYGDVLGHRGITHSLLFGIVLSACVAASLRKQLDPGERGRLAVCALLATVSHGVLDAFTNGGLGVAFFAPFDTTRYFFPVTPIPVSPIGAGFFSERGAEVFAAEFVLIWIPALAAILLARRLSRR
jgi:inner membrane protein